MGYRCPMGRSTLTATTLVVAAVLLMPPVAAAFHPAVETVPWSLQRVSPSGRTLVLTVFGGGCWSSSTRQATVIRQDRHVVELRVEMTQSVPDGPDEVCTADLAVLRLFVGLAAPLNGRALHFQTTWSPTLRFMPPSVPQMVGVRGRDAVRALANQSILARIVGPADGVVVRQGRAARTGVPRVTSVTLVTRAKLS